MISIQYSINLPSGSDNEVLSKIQKVRSHCQDQAFLWTTPLAQVSDPLHLISLKPSPFENEILAPRFFCGFAAGLGDGGKDFQFELYKYPERRGSRIPSCWFSNQTCWPGVKLDDRSFISRYRAVFETLEFSRSLGFQITIKDEAGYASAKSVEALLAYKKIKDSIFDPREIIVR